MRMQFWDCSGFGGLQSGTCWRRGEQGEEEEELSMSWLIPPCSCSVPAAGDAPAGPGHVQRVMSESHILL